MILPTYRWWLPRVLAARACIVALTIAAVLLAVVFGLPGLIFKAIGYAAYSTWEIGIFATRNGMDRVIVWTNRGIAMEGKTNGNTPMTAGSGPDEALSIVKAAYAADEGSRDA